MDQSDASQPTTETRATACRAKSINEDARTADIVWTTGATVRRMGWIADYDEELIVSDSAVNLERMSNAAPLLDSHRTRGLESVLGVHERVWLDDGQGFATVRFSGQAQGERAFAMVREGTAGKVSTGYAIDAFERVKAKDRTDGDNSVDLYRITRWTPHENSLVPVPADDEPGMGVRSLRSEMPADERADVDAALVERFDGCELSMRRFVRSYAAGAPTMSLRDALGVTPAPTAERDETPEPAEEPAPVEATAADAASTEVRDMSDKPEAAKNRENYSGAVVTAARACGLSLEDKAVEAILTDEERSTDQARADILEIAAKRSDEAAGQIKPQTRIEIGTEEREKDSAQIVSILSARAGMGEMPKGSDYAGRSMLSMGRRWAQRMGHDWADGSDMKVARNLLKRSGGHTTSDFAHILADVANKSLEAGYENTERNFTSLGRKKDLPDFRNHKMTRMSDLPELTKVNETGEYELMYLTDSGEAWSVARFGGRVHFSYELLVNDDLDALTDVPGHAGAAGARLETNLFWSVVTDNAAMSDGDALFHANHSNLRSAAAFGEAGLADMFMAMRQQTGPKGSKMGLRLKTVAIPVALWGTAQKLKAQIYPDATGSVVPEYIKALQFIDEPRLDDVSATAYYGFADDSRYGLVYGGLAGRNAVEVDSEIDFKTDGLDIKFSHVAGAGVSEFRGVSKNPGA